MKKIQKIGFGGGCHWCTEAVFQAVTGVQEVTQGYIASEGEEASYSEAVILSYDPEKVKLERLLEIHLRTHRSTSDHSFRKKYRSAVYFFSSEDGENVRNILNKLQEHFSDQLITRPLRFKEFKPSRESIQEYYKKNPDAPFCKRYIEPKLAILREKFPDMQ